MKNKAFEFRIYPNKEQKILLAKTFGCTRLVFNHFLALRKESYEESRETGSITSVYLRRRQRNTLFLAGRRKWE